MSIFDSIILGLVQGLTEFIPVSSSGHLVIAGHLLGLKDIFAFDVLLNFGTLLALLVYYRHKIWSIVKKVFTNKEWPLLAKLITATVPAVLFGLVFSQQIERLNDMLWVVIFMLVAIGIPMIVYGKQKDGADDQEIEQSISWMTSIKVGIAQALALVPGTSRSGVTILVGIKSGVSAKRAAEFSFLLAIPIIAGASLKTLLSKDGMDFINNNLGAVLVGNAVSFLTGLLAINFLITLISKRGLKDFGWYRIGLAGVLVILVLTGII